MFLDNRFIVLSDPKMGGVHLAYASKTISEAVLDEITDNYLELIADAGSPCACVYGLSDGSYIVAMGKRINGSKFEARPHEMIRGFVLEENELEGFCQTYMENYAKMQALFFPETDDLSKPECWTIQKNSLIPVNKKELLTHLDGNTAINLLQALKKIKTKKLKIQLFVPDGESLQILALLASISAKDHLRLFMTADGESTMKSPDILIMQQPRYQDVRKYKKMTLSSLLKMGSSSCFMNEEKDDQRDEEAEKMDDILQFCMDYLLDSMISDYELYEYMDEFREKEPALYLRVIRSLKKELFEFKNVSFYKDHYMKLLYLVFKQERKETNNLSLQLETAPYDFDAMYHFLQEKIGTNNRKFKKYLNYMIAVQAEWMTKGDI